MKRLDLGQNANGTRSEIYVGENEVVTRDIPNIGENMLRDLDESGIIRIGAQRGELLAIGFQPRRHLQQLRTNESRI